MANLPPGTVGVEYTRGTGAFFPTTSSIAKTTENATNAASAASAAGVGPQFPADPVTGQSWFLTIAPGPALYVWTGDQWQKAA